MSKPNNIKQASRNQALSKSILNKLALAFAPLNKFQKALCTPTQKKKPSRFVEWFKKNNATFVLLEKIVVISFIIFSLIANPYLLLILPAIGFLIFYRNRVHWLWWKVKVFILFRNYYEHRRRLYKQGSLYHHFNYKRPKKYKDAIIWGESESIQNLKFNKLQSKNLLTRKEYIHS